jgi:hypothetical protein
MGFFDKLCSRFFAVSSTQGQQEGKQIERLLRVALTETTTENEFNQLLARMIHQDGYLDNARAPRAGAGLIYRLLEEHKGLGQDWRTAAKRLIAYLPQFYGYESDWEPEKKS